MHIYGNYRSIAQLLYSTLTTYKTTKSNSNWFIFIIIYWSSFLPRFFFLGRRFVDHDLPDTSDRPAHEVDPHVSVLPCIHELAAEADVATAEEDAAYRDQGPKHQELLSPLRGEIDHNKLVVVLVIVAVVRYRRGVVSSVPAVLVVEMHALHAERVDTTFHVLQDFYPFEDGDVLLQRNHALIHGRLLLDEHLPVLPGLGVDLSEVGVVSFAEVVQPGPISAVRTINGIHGEINLYL